MFGQCLVLTLQSRLVIPAVNAIYFILATGYVYHSHAESLEDSDLTGIGIEPSMCGKDTFPHTLKTLLCILYSLP